MSEKLGIMAQQTANPAGVSPTGALGTAVDRMSFAHDIVMVTDDSIAVGSLDQVRDSNYSEHYRHFIYSLKIKSHLRTHCES